MVITDFLEGVPEVQGHRDAPRLQDAEVHRQPLQAVHHQDAHLAPPLHAPAEEQVGEAVGVAGAALFCEMLSFPVDFNC